MTPENWVERIRDPKMECMSRDEMSVLQGKKLVNLVDRVYNNVDFYNKKMKNLGVEPGDIKGIEDITKQGTYYHDGVFAAMNKLRESIDELETITSKTYWPYPSYGHLLFGIR